MAMRRIDWRSPGGSSRRAISHRVVERLTPIRGVGGADRAGATDQPSGADELGDRPRRPDQRVVRPRSGYVMASFTHLNRKGRGSAMARTASITPRRDEDAVAETVFHFEEFARDSGDPPRMEDMRVLVSAIARSSRTSTPWMRRSAPGAGSGVVHRAREYARVTRRGRQWRVYASVRRPAGECVGAFRPRAWAAAAEAI